MGNNSGVIDNIIELITHYHNDHVNDAAVTQTIQANKFQRIIGPIPKLETSRNYTFDLLNNNENKSVNEHILDITTSDGTPLDIKFTTVGDFLHSKFKVNEDITIELFKYQEPKNKVNDDGLIYKITHNGVTQLLFGDIDDINALENLVDASSANEKLCYEIDEEISALRMRCIEIMNEEIYNIYLLEHFYMIDPQIVKNKLQELEIDFKQINQKITKLEEEKNNFPYLKADIVKWMHHAHVFSETRALDVITKLHDVVEPQYIIWQRYNNQSDNKFEDFIKQFPFWEKCLNSGDRDITVISLEWIIKQILFS